MWINSFKVAESYENEQEGEVAREQFDEVKRLATLEVKDKLYNPNSKQNTLVTYRKSRSNLPASKYKPDGTAKQTPSIVDEIAKIEKQFDFDFFEELLDFQQFVKKEIRVQREIKTGTKEKEQKQLFPRTLIPRQVREKRRLESEKLKDVEKHCGTDI